MKIGVLEGLLFVTGDDGLSLEDVVKLLEVSKDEALKLLEQYKNGPTTITNPISIKTMKDFITETEQIVNPQIREDELAI